MHGGVRVPARDVRDTPLGAGLRQTERATNSGYMLPIPPNTCVKFIAYARIRNNLCTFVHATCSRECSDASKIEKVHELFVEV